MALHLNRIAKKTDAYRAKLAKASVGLGEQPLLKKFVCLSGGTDEAGNVTTPNTDQTISGDQVFEKDFHDGDDAILTTTGGVNVLRYDQTHWAVVSCELLKTEGKGFISQVVIYDQDGDVAIRHHLPKTIKTEQSFFLEEIWIGS